MKKVLLITRKIEERVLKLEKQYGENIGIISHYYTFSDTDTLYSMFIDLERDGIVASLDIPVNIVDELAARGVNISYI